MNREEYKAQRKLVIQTLEQGWEKILQKIGCGRGALLRNLTASLGEDKNIVLSYTLDLRYSDPNTVLDPAWINPKIKVLEANGRITKVSLPQREIEKIKKQYDLPWIGTEWVEVVIPSREKIEWAEGQLEKWEMANQIINPEWLVFWEKIIKE